MTRYAIVTNNTPVSASKAAIEAHATAQLGGAHPFDTIQRWTEDFRKQHGIHLNVAQVNPSLEPYQRKGGGTLSYDQGTDTVTMTYTASNVDLDSYKATRVQDAWNKANELIESGTVPAQSDTATTPVDHVFGTDTYTTDKVFNPIATAIANGIITDTVTLTPKGELAPVTFTVAEFLAAAGASLTKVDAHVKHYLSLKSQILQAEDHAVVAAIDLETGWPP